ncbi:MAG: hypothetical protein ABI369_02815 [Acetobacteraceae bacterium]
MSIQKIVLHAAGSFIPLLFVFFADSASSVGFPQLQCMSLAHLWNGEGPMPPPVAEYADPSSEAPAIGTAMATVVADKPIYVRNGRVRVVRPDGQVAWINRQDVTTWHVVSNPKARCSVVRLANGRIGTASR